jgi:hypothetical protein
MVLKFVKMDCSVCPMMTVSSEIIVRNLEMENQNSLVVSLSKTWATLIIAP